MPKFAVIVPAAGESRRFGGNTKKPFVKVDGREIVLRTVELFCNREDVVQTLLLIAPADLPRVKERYGASIGFMGVKLAEGGVRRVETVQKALALVAEEAEYVAIHDAVRPFLTQGHIDRVFAEAAASGAAILAQRMNDTLKKVNSGNVIAETIARENLWAAQTPQVFRKDLLLQAYAKLPADENKLDEITDDAQVLELAGIPVTVVPGPAYNLKITTPDDLPLAESILKAMPKKKVQKLGAFEEVQW